MAEGALAAGSGRRAVDDLLPLALSRPHEALAQARAVLEGCPDPYEASVAHQAAGIVLRDTGDVNAGVQELRGALRLARRTGVAEREADVLGSLGGAFVYAGRTADGLAALDRAAQLSTGVLLGRVLHRRGVVLWTLGRYAAALDDFRRAVSVLQRAGDRLWTARALSGRGLVYLALGSPARADDDFVAAERLFAQTSQELEAIQTVLNRGVAAFRSGDLPAALSFLDEAASRYRPLNVPTPFLSFDRCDVLLAAGLASEALAEADAAVRDIEQAHGWPTKKAELLLMAATCALAAGQPQAALDRAQAAHRLFRSQQSAWWQAHAGLVLIRSRYRAGQVSARLLSTADQAAARLEELGSAEAALAHLLAGRIALDLGRWDDADRHLSAAARARRRGPPMSRASGWLAEALRAQATAHGAELAMLAQRHAAHAHRPRLLLTWSERWRATALAVPAVRPPTDPQLGASLAALRHVTSELEEAQRQGMRPAALQREQRRLEKVVRGCSLRAPGSADSAGPAVQVAELLDELGPALLIEIVDVDGTLHVLVCGAGRVRQFTAGRTADALRAVDLSRFALRRLARSRPGDDVDSAQAIVQAAGPQLQDALLGPATGHLGDRHRPVVIVPPGSLHSIPWALLPVLAERAFTVAPSASTWLRAHAARPPSRRPVTLARGPGLVTDGAEVPVLAQLYDGATVLSGADATAGRVLAALDGAWLAHIAAHGRFRADSPLFSSLRMHDGPLTVYDFEQLHRAPYRLVLSSCDSGVLAPAGAEELLGLVSSLLPLGTAGIIASMVPLNDHAVVPLMVDLHRHLRGGQTLAEAMRDVRCGSTADPIQHGTALSLTALGAG